jgi:allophanate hydrolase
MAPGTATERVLAALTRIEEVERPEVWIALRDPEDLLAEATARDAEAPGSLHGRLIAVKDNIDVAGLPTTAGCPAFAYEPAADAPAVARLRAAGAIVLGKTNLDQFATGLVGTRSPYGAVRDALRPDRVSGGSSSGSAVAVALGIADAALGTDTAGSGRIPAAFQGLIGIKPTRGLIPTDGVVPACRTLDCVSVFASDLALAEAVMWVMATPDSSVPGPVGRAWPPDAPLAAPPAPRIAIPSAAGLDRLSPETRRAFNDAVATLAAGGATIAEIELAPFEQAGRLLYSGAFVAERYAAVGEFVDAHREEVDPTVGEIIATAGGVSASQLVADGEVLERLAREAKAQLRDADALLMPTASRQPTLAEVAADPVGVNSELGRYTSFANLLDMCVIAIPAGTADDGHFGVSLAAPAFADRVLGDLAARVLGLAPVGPAPASVRAPAPTGIPLLVIGAHRAGQPLNHQLTDAGARFTGVVETTPDYRMYALETEPPKPGLTWVGAGGSAIEGELWTLPPAALGPFLAALPRPMTLGQVTIADGRSVVGFGCEAAAVAGAPDISVHGSWLAYLDRSGGLV